MRGKDIDNTVRLPIVLVSFLESDLEETKKDDGGGSGDNDNHDDDRSSRIMIMVLLLMVNITTIRFLAVSFAYCLKSIVHRRDSKMRNAVRTSISKRLCQETQTDSHGKNASLICTITYVRSMQRWK